ncbi:MAG: nitrogen fixation protein NifQ [Uliginosibacterium sp.]|nr:nitrogen fixation protein NifQ [Uliginosibacterium sp.]
MNAPDLPLRRCITGAPAIEQLVLACALLHAQRLGESPLIRGLSAPSFTRLSDWLGAGDLENGARDCTPLDEFDELFALLEERAEPRDETSHWLAAAIATAAQRDNHLWQDLGLPSRSELSAILQLRFPTLAAENTGDMKWKKFFYRQLCKRAEVPICKSPHCAECCDYAVCFGPEI